MGRLIALSANLGFLWADRPLPAAIRAAKAAGFHAVECHWPYGYAAADVKAAIDETGLPMLGLNTRRGDVAAGDNGLSAVPGRQDDARAAIDEAIDYATRIGARHVHVMAGRATGDEARQAFCNSLLYACERGAAVNLTILIEPLNRHDAPGYFLTTTSQAAAIVEEVSQPNLKLMFDCYHVGRTEGDIITRLKALLPIVGHIQLASVPDRGAPDHGEIDYRTVLLQIEALGWTEPVGAEYKVAGDTDATLGWMTSLG